MAFEPRDPNDFFSLLGPDRVAAALIRGEITGDLKAKAQEWFSLNHMLATQTTGRKSFAVTGWQLALGAIGVAVAIFGVVLTGMGLVRPPG